MGSLYKRGKVWWLRYGKNGRVFRESSNSTLKMVAKKLLEAREGEIAQGRMPSIMFEKVTFEELAEDLLREYRINGRKSIDRLELSLVHLRAFFGGMMIPGIGTAVVRAYIEKRMRAGAANATINRELAGLKRMLNLGAQQTPPKVDRVPHIPMLRENNTRKGFFEHHEFLAMREALPEHLRPFVTFGYKTGWRWSEISNLKWPQVDLGAGTVRLEPGETKNDEARTIYLDEEVKGLLLALKRARKSLLPYVFLNRTRTNRIIRFDKAWATACKKAGVGEKLFHDLRRTAVRNMVRSGVPEKVAMMVSGHKTRSVFDRYNIVSDADLKAAAQKQEAYLLGTVLGTITPGNGKIG